jgi:hypothetical protein
MDEKALRIGVNGTRLLLRCRTTREDLAKRAVQAKRSVFESAVQMEERARKTLEENQIALDQRERDLLEEMGKGKVPAFRLKQFRDELDNLSAIGQEIERSLQQARALRVRSEQDYADARRTLNLRMRDTKKWQDINTRVVDAYAEAARHWEEMELDDEISDRYASLPK